MIEPSQSKDTGEQLLKDLAVCHSPRKTPHRVLPAALLWHVADDACHVDGREPAAPTQEVFRP